MEVEAKTVTVDVSEAFVVKTDASELCRLCANTDNQLIPIFKGEGIDHSIHSKIEKHIPIIKVTELDKLPLQICYQCASTLIAWHNLYEGCRVADKRLREILSIEEKIYQDEPFDDYVDDYRDDFEEPPQSSYDNLPSNTIPSTSNLASEDVLKPSTTQITQLDISKTFNETELDSTDERCDQSHPDLMKSIACSDDELSTKVEAILSQTDSNQKTRPVQNYFKCAECGKVFLREHNYMSHLRAHTNKVKCDQCGKSFKDITAMYLHKVTHAKEAKTNHQPIDDALKYCEQVMINGHKFVKCTMCAFLCRNLNAKFFKHFKQHEMLYTFCCENCGKQFRDKYTLVKHVKRQHENVREFTCNICERMFFDRHHLKQHVRIHTGEKPFVCEICGKAFAQVSSLFVHKKFHLGEKKHICQLCGRGFVTNSGLLVHIRRHTGERNHNCEQCSKSFVSSSQLKSHLSVHCDDKPFVCSDCGAEFKLKKYLKFHCLTHLQNE